MSLDSIGKTEIFGKKSDFAEIDRLLGKQNHLEFQSKHGAVRILRNEDKSIEIHVFSLDRKHTKIIVSPAGNTARSVLTPNPLMELIGKKETKETEIPVPFTIQELVAEIAKK